jgi:type II secretory pathway pseudopilin PulG
MHKNRNDSGFSIVEVLLVIVIVVFLGIVGLVVYQNHQKAHPKTVASSTSNSTDIINAIKSALATKFVTINSTHNPPNNNTLSLSTVLGGPTSAVSGYNFDVALFNEGYALNIKAFQTNSGSLPNPTIVTTIQNVISSEFKKLKLTTLKYQANAPGAANYQNNIAECSFFMTGNGGYPSSVACANKSTYLSQAAIIKPLAIAYYAAHPTTKFQKEVFGLPSIKNSNTPGYKFAVMTLDGGESYYYQKNGKWIFYEANMMGFFCTLNASRNPSINTSAKLAFMGQPCINSNGHNGYVQ